MNFRDPQSKPLWLERDAELYGRNLSPVEYDAELDEQPPRHRLLLVQGDRSSSSRAWSSAGADRRRPVTPLHQRPVPTHPSSGDGPDLPPAA